MPLKLNSTLTQALVYFNPLTHGPLWPPLSHDPRADLPYKNRADLPMGRELRATVIAALFPRVSWLNIFFKFDTLEYNFYIKFKCNSNGAIKK